MRDSEFYLPQGLCDLAAATYPTTQLETVTQLGGYHSMYQSTFLWHELDACDVAVERGDVFLDLGANIGVSSRYALTRGAREVFCYEPDPDMMQLLQCNLPHHARFFSQFITSERGEQEGVVWPGDDPTRTFTAPAITFREMLAAFPYDTVDYLKMDIEGAEVTAFDEMGWGDCARIRKMMVEHHQPDTLAQFEAMLCAKGFNVRTIVGKGQSFIYGRHI